MSETRDAELEAAFARGEERRRAMMAEVCADLDNPPPERVIERLACVIMQQRAVIDRLIDRMLFPPSEPRGETDRCKRCQRDTERTWGHLVGGLCLDCRDFLAGKNTHDPADNGADGERSDAQAWWKSMGAADQDERWCEALADAVGACILSSRAASWVSCHAIGEGARTRPDNPRRIIADLLDTLAPLAREDPTRAELRAMAYLRARPESREGVDGASLIAAERRRQVEAEGWTAEHDDRHDLGQMAKAAATLAVDGTDALVECPDEEWGTDDDPWGLETKHGYRAGGDEVRKLTIAGALIAAEIDRLLRARLSDSEAPG